MPSHEEQVAFKTRLWNEHVAKCEAMQARVDRQIAEENRRILMYPLVPFALMLVALLGVAIWVIDRECLDDWLDIL